MDAWGDGDGKSLDAAKALAARHEEIIVCKGMGRTKRLTPVNAGK